MEVLGTRMHEWCKLFVTQTFRAPSSKARYATADSSLASKAGRRRNCAVSASIARSVDELM